MNCSSSLTEDHRPLVLDTSVLINLHACTYGERILTAIPNEIIVPQIVVGELEHETSRRNGEHRFLECLIACGTVTIAHMTDEEFSLFADLTSGSGSLDDGEAATLSISATRHLLPVIDEKKGRARASLLMNGMVPCWTLDLLIHPAVKTVFGSDAAIDALYLALREGRMRISVDHCVGVVDLIGIERAMHCPSLPNFKSIVSSNQLSDNLT
jgi:predicted nucleic acid-binding protein